MADISKRLEKAEKYLQKGKSEDALEEYLGALEQDPQNVVARQNAADLCLTLGRESDAAPLLSGLFDSYAAANDQAKALATYKKFAKVGSPSTDQLFKFAHFSERTAKKEALDAYAKAADAYAKGKRENDQLKALERIAALAPEEENLKAVAELAAHLHSNRLAAESYFLLGRKQEEQGGSGTESFALAYKFDPSLPNVAYEHGRALLSGGDAEKAIVVLGPLADQPQPDKQHRAAYAKALVAAKRLDEAAPFVWEQFESGDASRDDVAQVMAAQLDTGKHHNALELARKLELHENKAGHRREYVTLMKELADKHPPDIDFLEYLVELFNANNREGDYCESLLKLFQLYYAANRFLNAADALERALEVDPYTEGHDKRIALLFGKIDANRFNGLAARLKIAGKAAPEEQKAGQALTVDSEPTVLEDLMLQAEIFLQYSMRSKAVERLERILKLFPREEEKNEKLRQLYLSAGVELPQYAANAAAASVPAPEAAPSAKKKTATNIPAAPAVAAEESVDNFSRVTEIARNIFRQANVKGVLFAAVNDVGRHWNVSRCVAGLLSPGKSPSAALEYCAPGVKQSDVMSIVKLLVGLQQLAVQKGVLSFTNAPAAPELANIRQYIEQLGITSLLAVPLCDADDHVGLLILEQCGSERQWRSTDVVVLKTIADQMTLAVNNAKLRSLVKNLAVTDEKSGLLRRSSYIDVLVSEMKRAAQQKSTTTVMLMHFGRSPALIKEIGEASVEAMMQQIGQVICAHIRQNDIAVRYQATTIALVLADTDEKNAFFVVDKFRKLLANIRVPNTDRMVAMSAGIAEAVTHLDYDAVDVTTEVINRAEAALEAALDSEPNSARSLAAEVPSAAVA